MQGDVEDQECAGYCLVTFSCSETGATILQQWVSLFLERQTSSAKLELAMTRW